jgi:hypothetical protein
MCEAVRVGQNGSPGPVSSTELLHSVLVAPGDYEKESITYTLISHTEKKGMSVMREGASNEEILSILNARISAPHRYLHGIASFACSNIRDIVAIEDDALRAVSERLFSVLDTDMPNLPHHADIFATVPSKGEPKFDRAEFKKVRQQMLTVMSQNIVVARDFREGVFAEFDAPKQGA